jgi:hypothetical protein
LTITTYRVIGGDRQEYGPSDAAEIQQWIAEGRLSGGTLARTEPDGMWQPLSRFPEFDQALEDQRRALGGTAAPPLPGPAPATGLNVIECLSRAWQLWTSNFGFLFAASFVVWMIGVTLQFMPVVGLLYWPLRGVLYGGLFIVVLRLLRAQEPAVNEVFSGFGSSFTQLALVGLTTSILPWFGMLFCVLPGVYLTVIWALSIPATADKQLDFWAAMERSRKAIAGQWERMFVLGLVAFLPFILTTIYAEMKIAASMYEALKPVMPESGFPDFATVLKEMNRVAGDIAKGGFPLVMASKFVLLLNLPFGISAIACAYEALIGKTGGTKR